MGSREFVKYACENVVLADEKQERVGWYSVAQKAMEPRVCSTRVASLCSLLVKQLSLKQSIIGSIPILENAKSGSVMNENSIMLQSPDNGVARKLAR